MTPTAHAPLPAILSAAAVALSVTAHAGDLEVTLDGIHSTAGQALVALHRHVPGATFPSDASVVANETRPAERGTVLVVFPDLPPGEYAVAGFHDANGDGELNANFVGMPTEGYGFSNGARGFMGPPGFDAAAVTVGRDARPLRIVVPIQCPDSER